MSTKVYANGREISGKASGNKSVAAMPDVCLSPPGPPAGPIPIPYPNTAQSSDTGDGSKTVFVNGKEVGLKNQSVYKTSKGDEAATRNFGGGVVSHTITGKTKFAAWSFDVKVEGQNIVRHMDLTTHNHQNPTNGAITLNTGSMFLGGGEAPEKSCNELQAENGELRKTADPSNGPSEGQLEEATTLTTAQYFNSGDSTRYNMRAFSRQVDKDGWAQGVGTLQYSEIATRKRVITSYESNIPGFKYKKTSNMPFSSHTEARIIEDIFAATNGNPKGKARLRIQWHQKAKGSMSCKACPECRRIICAAMNKGLEIELCDDTGKAKTPDWCDEFPEFQG
ncbi:DUF4150 domain-containing protein [Archangium violaceum]|uniref:DUF4150 domain-containing protein n=1 Tax=Archangium violaceum TaxID=83451 RepID=UPI00193C2B66|nr:DUF4150 domain-containing protein [Archangium violaceum]QRK06746.1 DUF4150 domain-containing protein [Archangium violaceum]